MYRDRDIVTKSEVVEQIDSEEHEYVRHPAHQWDLSRLEKERGSIDRGVSWPCEESDNNELDESYEEALKACQQASRPYNGVVHTTIRFFSGIDVSADVEKESFDFVDSLDD